MPVPPSFLYAELNVFPLWKSGSRNLTTLLPSTLTSRLPIFHVTVPLILLDMTPPPAEPASSPVLVEILAPTLATGFPSILTVSAPSVRSLSIAMLTYGMGTGPPGLGVLHTSGGAQVCVWPCPL